jgi:hypothetical protein
MGLDQTKRRALYNEPTGRLKREEAAAQKKEADRLEPVRSRHRKELSEMQGRHHNESKALGQSQRVEWDHHSQFPSRPANLEKNHAKARSDMDAKHKAEREKLKDRHEKEMTESRRKPPEARLS